MRALALIEKKFPSERTFFKNARSCALPTVLRTNFSALRSRRGLRYMRPSSLLSVPHIAYTKTISCLTPSIPWRPVQKLASLDWSIRCQIRRLSFRHHQFPTTQINFLPLLSLHLPSLAHSLPKVTFPLHQTFDIFRVNSFHNRYQSLFSPVLVSTTSPIFPIMPKSLSLRP